MGNMNSFKFSLGFPVEAAYQIMPDGVNFSTFSRNATKVFLELFEKSDSAAPFQTIELNPKENRSGDIWHVFVKGLKPGALYLYRFDGPFDLSKGHRFDPTKYVFDPKAFAFTDGSVFKNMKFGQPCPLEKMPKCVVVDPDDYDWEGDKPLKTPLNKSIIYELHVKGFTESPTAKIRWPGTYKGLTEKIPYLQSLGITAVELLPINEFDEWEVTNTNPKTGGRLKNYWGYSTIGFFAPKTSYAFDRSPGGAVREFKDMVKALHNAGIEVFLDVVFNHTAEGNENGPTLNFRAADNSIFYQLVNDNKQYYYNFSGCGNTFNCNHPVVQDFIMDCLRYWVTKMHVDGFRFDLASVLCRNERGFLTGEAPLPRRIAENPILRDTKIIAEPWDAGGAYQTGSFPGGRWCEWNDHFRDGIRKFIRGDEYLANEAATRIAGSSDLYQSSGRQPINSINYIACHDGFTLNDLVMYNGKHNEENGENNRDGSDNNNSWNCGFEGPCENPRIEDLREKQLKNMFVCLILAQGVPMIVAGDEVRRTQNGNNNPYCQDNEISWFNWDDLQKNSAMLDFVRKLIQLRTSHRVFKRRDFFGGSKTAGDLTPADISWLDYDGKIPDWKKMNRFLALRLGGGVGIRGVEEDNDFYIAFNTDIHDMTVSVPNPSRGRQWFRVIDTSITGLNSILCAGQEEPLISQGHYVIPSNSVVVLIAK